jgi:hypothetical protein
MIEKAAGYVKLHTDDDDEDCIATAALAFHEYPDEFRAHLRGAHVENAAPLDRYAELAPTIVEYMALDGAQAAICMVAADIATATNTQLCMQQVAHATFQYLHVREIFDENVRRAAQRRETGHADEPIIRMESGLQGRTLISRNSFEEAAEDLFQSGLIEQVTEALNQEVDEVIEAPGGMSVREESDYLFQAFMGTRRAQEESEAVVPAAPELRSMQAEEEVEAGVFQWLNAFTPEVEAKDHTPAEANDPTPAATPELRSMQAEEEVEAGVFQWLNAFTPEAKDVSFAESATQTVVGPQCEVCSDETGEHCASCLKYLCANCRAGSYHLEETRRRGRSTYAIALKCPFCRTFTWYREGQIKSAMESIPRQCAQMRKHGVARPDAYAQVSWCNDRLWVQDMY